VRRDPMAMLPFCGYNMGNYFGHWLRMRTRIAQPPKIFMVNWFRKGQDGSFLWPGYGENMRVLKWIVDRARGLTGAQETVVGWVPRPGDIDLSGLDIDAARFRAATDINLHDWKAELESQREFFEQIGPTMPTPLKLQRELLMANIEASNGNGK
jgi:phosphoenolpyruvate carboxykinase (GTP)